MKQYLELLSHVMENGVGKDDRTNTGTRSVFGYQMRFDLSEGFPLMTTKSIPFRWIAEELLWFLSGSTDEADLRERGVDIWKEWADLEHTSKFGREEGDLGPVYGYLWRNFGGRYPQRSGGIDQIARVIHGIRNNPQSRRHLVTGWDPREATQVELPPCHTIFQFYVANGKLSCQLYQRSADLLLGVPFNIASYALLTMMIAQICDLEPGEFIHSFGDVHIYNNHIKQVNTQLAREPKKLPQVMINPLVREIDDFTIDDFFISGYKPDKSIKAKVAV